MPNLSQNFFTTPSIPKREPLKMGKCLVPLFVCVLVTTIVEQRYCYGFRPSVTITRPQATHMRSTRVVLVQPPHHKPFSRINGNVASSRATTGALYSASSDHDHEEKAPSRLFGKIKKLHDPITYFVLGILAGFKWDWCFRSPIYWFAIGFTIKWYRARYVYKIPVWDRQPNWNNVITSKEQEKDLKAFTCKNCGSTIFIAKTREFFFEGDTGFGGLGCFHCGAKGKDNFVMDRDRIVEDVGDMDDYFEYERPLDFVSRAERRKLLKQTQGDEEKANQILLDRAAAAAGTTTETPAEEKAETSGGEILDETINLEPNKEQQAAETQKDVNVDEPVGSSEEKPQQTNEVDTGIQQEPDDTIQSKMKDTVTHSGAESITNEAKAPQKDDEEEPKIKSHSTKDAKKKKKKTAPSEPVQASTKPAKNSSKNDTFDLDGLDALDMDSF